MTLSALKPLENEEYNVVNVRIDSIKIRYRLRSPNEEKIKEIAESIKILGLLNAVTLDSENYLIAGFHRLNAMKLLGYETIPAIIKDYSRIESELGEIDENLARNDIKSHILIAEHMVKREELLHALGLRAKSGVRNSNNLMTTEDLAAEHGITKRVYRLKKQPAKILEDVRDALRETKWSQVLMDMVKLSQQKPDAQRKITELLISGKCSTFKKAFVEGNIEVYRRTNNYKIDFDMKERFGIPSSIMRFPKASSDLQKICNLVARDEDVQFNKRESLHFGETRIPVYQMAADHAEFLISYYTPEGGTVLDCYMGRGTNGFAALEHGRKFIGYDINKKNVDKTKEIMDKYYPESDYQLFHSDGVALEEFKDESEILHAVVTDPAYVLQAEKYSTDPRDLSNMNHENYMLKIRENFKNLSRLIKTSSFENKIFYPIIFKVGTGRKGKEGIIDMDFLFQQVAKEYSLVTWDKVFNKLYSPWGAVNWERNYVNGYVQKDYECNLIFCKF